MLLRIVISSLLLFAAPMAANARPAQHRSGALSSEFKAAGRSIPATLMALGYQDFGRLNLAQFINDIDTVNIDGASGMTIGGENNDGRTTARWTQANHKILVNKATWAKYPNTREMLALHEFLGLGGYADNEYRISQRMWTLSLNATQSALSKDELGTLAYQISQYAGIQMAGGVVGVGGGGENGTLYVRSNRTRKALEALNQSPDEATRQEAMDSLNSSLQSNMTVMYLDTLKPAAKKKLADRMAHPVCLVHAGTCPMPDPRATSCSCGSEHDGIVIYPY